MLPKREIEIKMREEEDAVGADSAMAQRVTNSMPNRQNKCNATLSLLQHACVLNAEKGDNKQRQQIKNESDTLRAIGETNIHKITAEGWRVWPSRRGDWSE